MNIKNEIKYFISKFDFLRAYNSPFKPLKLKWYMGKVAVGTPYFFPRRWVNDKEKPGYTKAIPKLIGFDFVSLGWKTKWVATDYRFEWSPIWSFVFFKWQLVIVFKAPEESQYWECWLYYTRNTDKTKSVEERIFQCKSEFPCIWTTHLSDGRKETIDYYSIILREKYR